MPEKWAQIIYYQKELKAEKTNNTQTNKLKAEAD